MPKLRRLTIGYTEHTAPHRAYRTLCGRSVELASPGRKAVDECDECRTARERMENE